MSAYRAKALWLSCFFLWFRIIEFSIRVFYELVFLVAVGRSVSRPNRHLCDRTISFDWNVFVVMSLTVDFVFANG